MHKNESFPPPAFHVFPLGFPARPGLRRAAGADSAGAATLSHGLKTYKIPAQGLIWGCPAPGKSRGWGGCSWLHVAQAETCVQLQS